MTSAPTALLLRRYPVAAALRGSTPVGFFARQWEFESEVVLARARRFRAARRGAARHGDPLRSGDGGAARPSAASRRTRPETRLNDGKVGPDGAFWVGSMDDRPQKEPIGALYRVDPSGEVERKVEGALRLQRARLDRRRRGHVPRRFARALDRPLALRPLERSDVRAHALRRARRGDRPAGRRQPATRRVSTGAPASPPGGSTASRRTAALRRPTTCRCRRRPCHASAGRISARFS